jgi:hypothetical protein
MAEAEDNKGDKSTGESQRESIDQVFDVRAKVRGAIALLEAMSDYDDDDGTRKADAVWLLRTASDDLTRLAEVVDRVPASSDDAGAK